MFPQVYVSEIVRVRGTVSIIYIINRQSYLSPGSQAWISVVANYFGIILKLKSYFIANYELAMMTSTNLSNR